MSFNMMFVHGARRGGYRDRFGELPRLSASSPASDDDRHYRQCGQGDRNNADLLHARIPFCDGPINYTPGTQPFAISGVSSTHILPTATCSSTGHQDHGQRLRICFRSIECIVPSQPSFLATPCSCSCSHLWWETTAGHLAPNYLVFVLLIA